MGGLLDETGIKYGRLLVLEMSGQNPSDGQYTWLCECDCGKRVVVRGCSLRRGDTKSCGCYLAEQSRKRASKPDGESAFNSTLDTYKRNAAKRGHKWFITADEFRQLTQMDCHYCGQPPSNVRKRGKGSRYTYSGLDRQDNSADYSLDTVVPCCANCNRSKYQSSEEAFIRETHLRSIRMSSPDFLIKGIEYTILHQEEN